MSDMNIGIPYGKSKRLLTGGKYCPADIVVATEADESKIIHKTVSGENIVTLDDVSEIPHKCEVTVQSGDTLTVTGRNIFGGEALAQRIVDVCDGTRNDADGTIAFDPANRHDRVLFDKFRPNTQYTFTFFGRNSGDKNHFNLSVVYTDGTQTEIRDLTATGDMRITVVTTLGKSVGSLRVTWYARQTVLYYDLCGIYEGNVSEANFDAYDGAEYTVTPGVPVAVNSVDPVMNLFADGEITIDYHRSYGMQLEYDRFWDAYQENGTRLDYTNGFGVAWTLATFKPKYDMRPTIAYMMFRLIQLNNVDLVEYLDSIGVELDFSNCTNAHYAFWDARIKRLGVIDIRKSVNNNSALSSPHIETIDKLIVTASTAFDTCFSGASGLTNITIEGVLGNASNFSSCVNLSKASITSIINALSTTTSGVAATFSKAAVNTAFETSAGAADGSTSAEWTALANTRSNWTISLV